MGNRRERPGPGFAGSIPVWRYKETHIFAHFFHYGSHSVAMPIQALLPASRSRRSPRRSTASRCRVRRRWCEGRNPYGAPWPPDTFNKQFSVIAKIVGLHGFRFHDIRHAFATLTLADGRPVKEVQLLMGHSTANTTLAFYAHPVHGLGREAVNRLSRSLLRPRKGPETSLPNVTKSP